jgi:hypothetical protein
MIFFRQTDERIVRKKTGKCKRWTLLDMLFVLHFPFFPQTDGKIVIRS